MARNELACEQFIDVIQLIANKHRFRIICLLSRGDYCVSEIAAILQTDKLSNLSQQLKVLRLSGVVTCRRDEKRMVYSLCDERIGRLITVLREDFLPLQRQARGA